MYGELHETAEEMDRQDTLWGIQDHPDVGGGGGVESQRGVRAAYLQCLREIRKREDFPRRTDVLGWDDILLEEVYEALSEPDDDKRRTELVQVAAVALQWAGAIRRRQGRPETA